jgi:hypothetical protein
MVGTHQTLANGTDRSIPAVLRLALEKQQADPFIGALAADMRIRSASQSSPEHWSKDYAEHLRSVHFALLTVAVSLILLLTSKTYDPRAAAEQMDVVVKHDALWRLNGVFNEPAESGDRYTARAA